MWPPRNMAKNAARTERKVNPATERLCWFVKCAICSIEVIEKEAQLDHINPAVPLQDSYMSSVRDRESCSGTADQYLGSYMRRMLPEAEGFQVLCRDCHRSKTNEENKVRREYKKLMALFNKGGDSGKGGSKV